MEERFKVLDNDIYKLVFKIILYFSTFLLACGHDMPWQLFCIIVIGMVIFIINLEICYKSYLIYKYGVPPKYRIINSYHFPYKKKGNK